MDPSTRNPPVTCIVTESVFFIEDKMPGKRTLIFGTALYIRCLLHNVLSFFKFTADLWKYFLQLADRGVEMTEQNACRVLWGQFGEPHREFFVVKQQNWCGFSICKVYILKSLCARGKI